VADFPNRRLCIFLLINRLLRTLIRKPHPSADWKRNSSTSTASIRAFTTKDPATPLIHGGPWEATSGAYEYRGAMHKRIMDEGMLEMPMMIYWGRNDPLQPLKRAMALYDLLAAKNPNVQLMITNKAERFSYRERPEVFNQVVINWSSSRRDLGVIEMER
jgi:pimeloyl-ACP methyl ester carboxylesterase